MILKRYPNLRLLIIVILFCLVGSALTWICSQNKPADLNAIAIWLNTHQGVTLIWRLTILMLFLFNWPFFIMRRARAKGWPAQNARMAIRLGYVLAAVLLMLDILLHSCL